MKTWREAKTIMSRWLGSDVDVVRKVEQMSQRQREMGHKLRNMEMRLEGLVRAMREEERHDDCDSLH